MKKNYFIALLALVVNFAIAQIEPTTYRGAFAPSPTAPWTDSWTEFNPKDADYTSTKPVVVISTDITANTTWSANNVYELRGTIFVRNNATLTISAGTFIKSNVASTALIVTRGAKLNAIGTATNPIVFTSKNAAGSRNRGDWGGILLLGKGRYNLNNGVNYIEGVSQTEETKYGGGLSPVNDDNSGTLKYVRIEFAGYVFSENNELNGLTMGGVGSGTTIDYVQVSYSNDDSFEWFGGSVNCKHLVAFAGLDDDFDTDNGYNGKVQFGLAIKDPSAADVSVSECFESDNHNPGTATGVATTDAWTTSGIFTNFTCVGPMYRATLTTPATTVNALHDKAARIRRSSELKVFNSLFLDFKTGVRFENNSVANFTTANTVKWQNNIIAGSTPIISSTTAIADKYAAGNNSSLSGTTTTTAATGTSLILVDPYPANSGNTTVPGYTGRDYRPGTGSPALSGAAFTDGVFTGNLTQVETASPIVTTPINYCKGAVATPLTAVNSVGTSLRWYTALNGGTGNPVAPTPSTSTVGSITYYVTQRNNSTGLESTPRTAIVVTTLAVPAVALGTITNGNGTAAITAIGQYVGTTTEVTYSVPASTEDGVTSYFWTVPLGTTIISDPANTNVLTVNFQNVPAGAEAYGTIGVQAVNTTGCRGVVKTVSLTKVLPTAPTAIVMNAAGSTTAVTSFAKYMGTNGVLTLTPSAVPVATSYVWELPTGVNPVLGTAGTPVVKNYGTTYPFTNQISRPTTNGTKFYEVTETPYSSGVTIQTCKRITVANSGTPVYTNFEVITNTFITGVVIGGVAQNVAINPAYPIVSTTSASRAIQVDFAGVTSANTFNYSTTAGVSTNVLRIGVKSSNGVGVSTTPNTALVNPGTTSTAKLLTLTAIAPAAPAAIKLTNPALTGTAATTAITIISKYLGTETPLTLTATASVLASSYEWELPTWVNVVSGNPLTDNVIIVNFAGNQTAAAPAGVTSYYFGAKAKNGVGPSVTNNATLTPGTSSTAKLLKVTTSLPAAVTTVTGQIVSLCGGPYSYTMTASALANSYVITAPTNAVVTSASNSSNNSNVLTTSDLTFSVTYPAGFTVTTSTAAANKSLVITSVNTVGNSATNKTLALTTTLGAVGTHTNSYVNPNTLAASATSFGKCAVQTIAVPAVPYATSYVWILPNGATGTSETRTIDVDFAAVATPTSTTKVTVKVKAFNGCVYSAEKSILLTFDGITLCPDVRMASNLVSLDASQIYPNPTSDNFNIDLTSSISSEVLVTIYSMNGSVVKTNKIQLNQGLNTINEDITSLGSGIYFVRLVNESNNETIVRKLIKR